MSGRYNGNPREDEPAMIVALLGLLLLQSETVTTEHFEIVSSYRESAYVREVAAALESGYDAMAGTLGKKPAEPKRYRIHLHAKLDEYQAKDRDLNKGRFAANWAFSHRDTGESYLALSPRSGVPLLDRTRAVFRHEAFHLMVYRHWPEIDRSPAWLHEGMCERAAEQADRRGETEPAAVSINFAESVHVATAMMERKRFIPLAALLTSDSSDHKDGTVRTTWYSEAWLLVKYLAEKRPEVLKKILEGISKLTAAETTPVKVRDLLVEGAGEPLDKVEAAWIAWIESLKPAPWWRISGDWRMTADGVEGAAYWSQSAYLLSAEKIRAGSYRIVAEAKVESLGAGQVDLSLSPSAAMDLGDDRVVALVSRGGYANILVCRKGKWTFMATEILDPARLPADKWVRLELEVNDRTVRLKLDGFKAVEHTFADKLDELHDVRWGVGNYDSWTRFRAMEARKN